MRRASLILLSVFFSISLSAQTVDEIIAKNLEAEGGIAKRKSIQSLRITGNFETSGMQLGFTQVFKRPLKTRTDITVQGMSMVQAYDGKAGWQIMPFSGKKDAELMTADELKNVQEEADFDGPLMDYHQKGNKVELVGKEKVEGTDAYHLKVTLKNGDVRDLFLDADSFLAIKSHGKTTMRGTEVETESALGDYKQVDGIMIPFSIEQRMTGGQMSGAKITLTKVEFNVPVDDAVFKMPAATTPPPTPASDEPPKKPDAGGKPPQN